MLQPAPDSLPPATEGEGSFAASGTCLVTHGEGTAWVGTGAGVSARVLKTTDRGRSWTVADTPIVGGMPTASIASLAFRDSDNGAALGGVIDKPDEYSDNVAVTNDGGRTWTLAGRPASHSSGMLYGYNDQSDCAVCVKFGQRRPRRTWRRCCGPWNTARRWPSRVTARRLRI